MAGDVGNRIFRLQRARKLSQPLILPVIKRAVVAALEFDADREIVAAAAPAPIRFAGVPCPLAAWHELDDFAVAAYHEVRRDLEAGDPAVIRVRVRVESVGKEIDDPRPAI